MKLVARYFTIGGTALAILGPGCKSDRISQSLNVHTTGDSVTLASGAITVIVPPGAVSENGTLVATPLSAGDFPASPLFVDNSAYRLTEIGRASCRERV